MEICWKYKNKCLESPPDGFYGFIYLLSFPNDKTGEINYYIGKKAFTHRKKKALSKRARIGTRKRVEINQVDSGWKNYFGSSKPLLEYIKQRGSTEGFKRRILKLCLTKQDLTYWEIHILCENKVLFRNDCWNGNILSRFFKGKINE